MVQMTSLNDFHSKLKLMLQETSSENKLKEMEKSKDAAYAERNKLVVLLSKLFPAGLKETPIEGWDPAWFWCVYIDLPTGQASWHIRKSELPMFSHLKLYKGEWDGHSTEEKYKRIAKIKPRKFK